MTYLQLVAIGMLFAFAAAAIAEAFLVADVSVGAGLATADVRPGRWRRILKGIGLGPVLNFRLPDLSQNQVTLVAADRRPTRRRA